MDSNIVELSENSLAEIEGGSIYSDIGDLLGYSIGRGLASMGTSRIWWSHGYPSVR